jgi:hypothetical protein
VVAGLLYGGDPVALTVLALVWGVAVVADSAQFSACISELADSQYVGTALTLQTSMGFLLTLVTIRLLPTVERLVGRQWPSRFWRSARSSASGPCKRCAAPLRLRSWQVGVADLDTRAR